MIEVTDEIVDAVLAMVRARRGARVRIAQMQASERGYVRYSIIRANEFIRLHGQYIYDLRVQTGSDVGTAKRLTAERYPTPMGLKDRWHGAAVRHVTDRYAKSANLPLLRLRVGGARREDLPYRDLQRKMNMGLVAHYRGLGKKHYEVADALNSLGYKTLTGRDWTESAVKGVWVLVCKSCTPVQKYRPRPARRTGPRNEHHIG